MNHVHFDLDEVRHQIMDLTDRNRDVALALQTSELGRAYCLAQHAMGPAAAEAIVQNVRMMNDGRDAAFIGGVFGNFIGSLIANVVMNSPDREVCLMAIQEVTQRAVRNGLGEKSDAFSSAGNAQVIGERGGRA